MVFLWFSYGFLSQHFFQNILAARRRRPHQLRKRQWRAQVMGKKPRVFLGIFNVMYEDFMRIFMDLCFFFLFSTGLDDCWWILIDWWLLIILYNLDWWLKMIHVDYSYWDWWLVMFFWMASGRDATLHSRGIRESETGGRDPILLIGELSRLYCSTSWFIGDDYK